MKKLKEIFGASLLFFSLGTISYIVASENPLQEFTPRRLCMFNNEKLIITHFIGDSLIFLAYVGIAFGLYSVYKVFRHREIPFKGFLWMYAGFIFLCGLTHLIGVVNLFITFYWLDGIVKLLTAWFSIATAVSFLKALSLIKNLKTPSEYQKLAEEVAYLKRELLYRKRENE